MLRFIVFTFLIYLNWSVYAQERLIVLPIGKTYSIPFKPSQQVHISEKKFLKVYPIENKLLISAKKVGETHINVGSQKHKITVLSPQTYQTYKVFLNTLKNKQGLKIKIVHSEIVIYGQLHKFSDWLELSTLNTQYETNYLFKAYIDKDIQKEIKIHFQNLITHLDTANTRISLEKLPHIEVSHKSILDPIDKVFTHFGIPVVHNKNMVQLKPLIKVKILIAEVNRSFHQQLGIDWEASLKAQLIPEFIDQSLLLTSLKALETQGQGKVLSSPMLLCRSGSQAQFLAGGEFPIKITTRRRYSILWKKYGILLKIKPKADTQKRMSIEIQTEISSIDPARTIDGIPGLKINRMASHFDLQKSRTISLSGLTKNNFGHSEQGLPYLSQIPILGSLFKSKNYHNNQTDLIIFVTPLVQ